MHAIKKINQPLPLSILTGFLLGTSIIPFPPWALFFCLAPLFKIWLSEKPKKVFLYTSLSFFIASLISLFWFSHLFTAYAKMPFPLSLLITLLIAYFYHIHLALTGYLYARWLRAKFNFPLLGLGSCLAFVWLVTPSIFPWNLSLAWLYGGLKAYEFSDIFGADGLHALTIFINLASLWAFQSWTHKNYSPLFKLLSFLFAINFLGHVYGKLQTVQTPLVLKVAIAQANIPNMEDFYNKVGPRYASLSLKKYFSITDLSSKTKDLDLIVWPETALPKTHTKDFLLSWQGSHLKNYISSKKANLITGTFARDRHNQLMNTALFLDRNGEQIGSPVPKKLLLAFGEYLPGETYLPFLRKALPMVGEMIPGKEAQVRALDKVNIGMQICYEGLFPRFTRDLKRKKAEVLVNLTNDSWYGPFSEPLQHLYLSAFRAIEQRLPLIRSTNTGISTVILPSGKILERSPLNQEWGGYYEVPYVKDPKDSLYQKFGYLLTLPLLLIVFMISLVYGKKRT